MERVKQGGGMEFLEGFQGNWDDCWAGVGEKK